MKRIFVPLLVLLALSATAAAAPSLREQLVGTWRLVSIQNRDSAEQQWQSRFGDSPQGYLMYDATGHMAVQIQRTPTPPKLASNDDWTPTPEEARAFYLGYLAYFGTFSVDESGGVVTHHVEGSLRPSFLASAHKRPAKLEGDRLILADEKTFRVVWERVR